DPWSTNAVPSRRDEPGFRQVLARVQQVSASPSVAAAIALSDADVSAVLPLVQARTMVMYAQDARMDIPAHARFLAEHIPDAELVAVPGADIYYSVGSYERTAQIEEFLTGTRPITATDRVLATVLFT